MTEKIGRNNPCPCGSGKKYKKCCLAKPSQLRKSTPPGKFRFEPGSYGHPESCMPSIACLRNTGVSSEYHFVLVKPDAVMDSTNRAYEIATNDLNAAFSAKTSPGTDMAVAMSLRERGYVKVDDFKVVDDHSDSTASWMEDEGLHFVDPGHAPAQSLNSPPFGDQEEQGPKVPTRDYFEAIDLDHSGDLEETVENLVYDFETGYFLCWEAVIRHEQGLRLSQRHEEILAELISFNDDDEDDPILYIDEMPRPKQRWYEVARQIVPRLVREFPIRTDESTYGVFLEGWPKLAEALEQHGQDLSLPEGAHTPFDIFDPDLRHRLWLQSCAVALCGLGQSDDLSLVDDGQHYRIKWLIESLQEHKDTIQYFDLTLEKLLTMVKMPARDEKIFMELFMKEMGFTSVRDHLTEFL